MKKYNGLLTDISQRYNIKQGESESESSWKTRIIYSICGMMAYASLWDDGGENPISIIHFKRRIRDILGSYRTMYSEISARFPVSDELEDQIYDIFKSTGVIYHISGSIRPSIRKEAQIGDVILQRGISPDDVHGVSGIGLYTFGHEIDQLDNARLMFGLEELDLCSIWKVTLSSVLWKSRDKFDISVEYLRMKPPFTKGYWINVPDTSGNVSLLRVGDKDPKLYYLYRYMRGHIEFSPLKYWQVENYNYRTLASACLFAHDTLPPIEYSCDGELVHLHLNYLLPPKELGFLKLYTWPEICNSFPCDFKRECALSVFPPIKSILTDQGYSLKEV